MKIQRDNIHFTIDQARSIEELAAAREREGTSVLRSFHNGNASAHNMALLDAGIDSWLVDYLNAGSDALARPDHMLRDGEAVRLTAVGTEAVRCALVDGTDDTRLSTFHAASLREAFPAARLETASEYLTRHRGITEQVIEATDKLASGGDASPAGAEIDSCKIGNTRMLIITFIAEALESGRAHQIHVGGSRLHRYIGRVSAGISAGITAVKKNTDLGADLPETIEVTIVPASHAVFATTIDKRGELDTLVEAVMAFGSATRSLAEQKRTFFSHPVTSELKRRNFAAGARQAQAKLRTELQEVVAAHGHLIADRSTGLWASQYDVMQAGGLYSHELNRTLPMRQLAEMHKQILKARQRNSDTIKLTQETNTCG